MGIGQTILGAARSAAPDLMSKLEPVAEEVMNKGVKQGWEALKSITSPVSLPNGTSKPIGEYIGDLLRTTQTQKSLRSGEYVSNIKQIWDGVDDATRLQVKQNPTVAPNQLFAQQNQAASIINDLGTRNAKVLVGGQRVPIYQPQDFFPKVLTEAATKVGSVQNDLIDHFVTSGQVPSRVDAEQLVKNLSGAMHGRKAVEWMHDLGGLQIPDQFLEQDPKIAFSQWADRASEYITKYDAYGPTNAKLQTLVKAVGNLEGKTAQDLAFAAINSHEYGYFRMDKQAPYFQGKTGVETAIREFEGLTKLGRVGIAEPSQALNTLIFNNLTSFGKGIADFISNPKDAMDFTLKAGALVNESLQDFKADIHGRQGWLSTMLHYSGFDAMRRMNLILAANTSKHYATELAEKLVKDPADLEANTMLRNLGLEPSAVLRQNGMLSPTDILTAARRGTEATQFFNNPLDLPMYWNKNPMTRVMSLYKHFIFNQAKFTKDYIFKSYQQGKMENIAYMVLLFPVVGELVGDAESLARGQSTEQRVENSPLAKTGLTENKAILRYVDNLARVGHIGMFYSMMGALNRGNMSNWIAGPVAGDIEDFSGAAWKLLKGDGSDKMLQTIESRVPVVGPAIKNLTGDK